jgi:S1-C subfamily serine protease
MRSLIRILMLCSPATAGSQQPAQRLPSASTQQAVSGVRRATVTISAVRPEGDVGGSGFVLTSEGLIATAAHIIRGATAATVRLTTGEAFDVQGIVVIDEARDFALLRIAGFGLATATLGNSDSVEVGRRLLAFGAPLGL